MLCPCAYLARHTACRYVSCCEVEDCLASDQPASQTLVRLHSRLNQFLMSQKMKSRWLEGQPSPFSLQFESLMELTSEFCLEVLLDFLLAKQQAREPILA